MTSTCETRQRANADRAPEVCLAEDSSEIKSKSPAVQDQIIWLRRDFIFERLRIVMIKAAHGADNVSIGDDLAAERDIRIAVENLKEAAASFRQLQRDSGEERIEEEAR